MGRGTSSFRSGHGAGSLAVFAATAVVLVLVPTGRAWGEGWDDAAALGSDRSEHTATLLNDGRVLLAGGNDAGALSSSEIFDPASGAWSTVGSLGAARFRHTATLLRDGRVLTAGGDDSGALATSELFDPTTGNWSATTGSLAAARFGHTATRLQDGRVLVAGGSNGAALATSEIYDPATGSWTGTGGLGAARSGHTATLLADGRVLVAGGTGGAALASAEIYDPATGLWSATGGLAAARTDHTATLLRDGTVLVAGGANGTAIGSSELFDPATGTWSSTGALGNTRFNHTATLLTDGRVLAAGGRSLAALASSEIFDPTSGLWGPTAENAGVARSAHTATLLVGGRVLAAGGHDAAFNALGSGELFDPTTLQASPTDGLNLWRRQHQVSTLADGSLLLSGGNRPSVAAVERYDPETSQWSNTGSMAQQRRFHSSTLLVDRTVLVAGGAGLVGDPVSSAELFDPDLGTWSSTGSLAEARMDHASVLLGDGRVLAAGGTDINDLDLASAEIYDPSTGLFSATDSMSTARTDSICTVLLDGGVLNAGGISNDLSVSAAEIYNPTTGLWTNTGSLGDARALATLTLLADGRVLAVGGADQTDEDFVVLASAEIYDPGTGLWSATGSLANARFDHAATLLPDGRVLISGGFVDTFLPTASMEIFDPAGNGGAGSFSAAGSMATARGQHTADLLPDGEILVTGGSDSLNLPEALGLDRRTGFGRRPPVRISDLRAVPLAALGATERVDLGLGFLLAWRPVADGVTNSLVDGQPLVARGSGFEGRSEAGGGNGTQSSAGNHPVVQIRTLENDLIYRLLADPASGWSDSDFRSTALSGLPEGHYRVTLFVNGIPSRSVHGLRDDFGTVTDLGIAKSDGEEGVEPGDPVVYTIVGTNSGPNGVTAARVVDTFPGLLEGCTWTCATSGFAVCTPGPVAGDIDDFVNLAVGSSVTYTASCNTLSAVQGKVVNTVTIAPPAGIVDSFTANDAATDETDSFCSLLELTSQVIDTTETFNCKTIEAGDGLAVESPGDVTFIFSAEVALRDGFSVGDGARLTISKALGTGGPSSEE